MRSVSGAAIVELAVVAPLLLLMVLGVADFGRVLYTSIILSHAARAGAQYGAQTNGTTGDSAGIREAAIQEAQDIGPIDVTSQQVCECLPRQTGFASARMETRPVTVTSES